MTLQLRLRQYGLWLFLLGLLLGFALPAFANRSLALGVHTTALMSGTFLLALAAHWPSVSLSPRNAAITAHAFALAQFTLTLGLGLLATLEDFSERSSVELLGTVLNVASAVVMVIAMVAIMAGFGKQSRG